MILELISALLQTGPGGGPGAARDRPRSFAAPLTLRNTRWFDAEEQLAAGAK